MKILIREDQIAEVEHLWSRQLALRPVYRGDQEAFEAERKKLRKKLGHEPGDREVVWSLANQELVEHARKQNWGLYRNARMHLADVLLGESRMREALGAYLELCYIDLNGPVNVGGISDPELLREFPPWNPSSEGFLAPAIVERLGALIEQEEVTLADVKALFMSRAKQLKKQLRLPVDPDRAWHKLASELEIG